ncbi:MAG: hypothetical protein LKU_02042 [Lactobacillus kefiranofaciens]|uniref:hypothetical protein n=1 Tax=Lactobacillus kefiranofaciens TaxID=267818 RepID=UPI000BA5D866|nr:hypothetical protein [Lactobacillus kefiranofaciens]MCJ2172972.1 hypothetical protein [Lactobacillus kefiranofaciens]MCP9331688.1 hypothetical protein [Lactobacillus kefiranofaciens]PAK97472.1 hypothetical protein B8W86_09830 [Lactobacillus kefiranofaciens]QNT43930.1 hypothetical protein ICI50_08990 [Lactobacillus kefiranofaciens]
MKAKEINKKISYTNYQRLIIDITNLILQYEPQLTKNSILHDIDVRNKQGEGLMYPSVLSMHVQDELVKQDVVFYITLSQAFRYVSKIVNQEFQIKKLVLIIVNPQHKLDHLSKLMDFIS